MNFLKSLPTWWRKRSPRMLWPNILANALLVVVAVLAPHQAPVVVYKLGAVLAAACLGHMVDLALFPYSQPSGYLRVDWREVESFEDDKPDFGVVDGYEWAFAVASARRAAIVCACMLAVALAL